MYQASISTIIESKIIEIEGDTLIFLNIISFRKRATVVWFNITHTSLSLLFCSKSQNERKRIRNPRKPEFFNNKIDDILFFFFQRMTSLLEPLVRFSYLFYFSYLKTNLNNTFNNPYKNNYLISNDTVSIQLYNYGK